MDQSKTPAGRKSAAGLSRARGRGRGRGWAETRHARGGTLAAGLASGCESAPRPNRLEPSNRQSGRLHLSTRRRAERPRTRPRPPRAHARRGPRRGTCGSLRASRSCTRIVEVRTRASGAIDAEQGRFVAFAGEAFVGRPEPATRGARRFEAGRRGKMSADGRTEGETNREMTTQGGNFVHAAGRVRRAWLIGTRRLEQVRVRGPRRDPESGKSILNSEPERGHFKVASVWRRWCRCGSRGCGCVGAAGIFRGGPCVRRFCFDRSDSARSLFSIALCFLRSHLRRALFSASRRRLVSPLFPCTAGAPAGFVCLPWYFATSRASPSFGRGALVLWAWVGAAEVRLRPAALRRSFPPSLFSTG